MRWNLLRRWIPSGLLPCFLLGCGDLIPITTIPSDASIDVPSFDGGPIIRSSNTPPRDVLGLTCTSNGECGSLICWQRGGSIPLDGAPARGYCTAVCAPGADAFCAAAGGTCVSFTGSEGGAQLLCVQTCLRGVTASEATKCRGRFDLACTPRSVDNGVPSGDGECLPVCTGSECGSDSCDPETGLCVASPKAGQPTGARCTSSTSTDDAGCAGVCLAVQNTHVCAERCSFGDPNACRPPLEGVDGGKISDFSACIFVPTQGVEVSSGDEAHCAELCDADSDCLDQSNSGAFCNRSKTVLGHGFCDFPGNNGGQDSGEGGADAASNREDAGADESEADAASE